jgi:hypothetical protein
MRILNCLAVPALIVFTVAGCATAPAPEPATSVPVTSQTPAETPVAADPTQCADANLTIALTGGEFDAGVTYYELVFTNVGSDPCTLEGFPQLWASDGTNRIGSAAEDGDSYPVEQFTLSTNDAVSSSFSVVELTVDSDDCGLVNGSGYEVIAPGETTGQYIEAGTVPACSLEGPTWLGVTAVAQN